jgi:hypothetical protein
MLERVHGHIVIELQQGARTDTVFVITAVVFNLIVLAVNSILAAEAVSREGDMSTSDLVLTAFIIMNILANGIAIAALSVGKQSRGKLLTGLLAMYHDNDVEKYYDVSLLSNYNKRYLLFIAIILCLAVTAVVVPLIIRFA